MTNEDFLTLRRDATKIVSRDHVESRISEAVDRINRLSERYGKPALAWSGGKDSRVLELIAGRAGITNGVLGISRFEFPSFLTWLEKHQPSTIETIRCPLGYDFLRKNPDMIFAADSAIVARWCQLKHISAQYKYAKENHVRLMLLGRRRQDGNYLGNEEGFSFEKDGVIIAAPIGDWSHAEIFATIGYYGISLPPIYDWEAGYLTGAGTWANFYFKKMGIPDGWAYIYRYEPTVVYEAAAYIPDAYAYLESVQDIPVGLSRPEPIAPKRGK